MCSNGIRMSLGWIISLIILLQLLSEMCYSKADWCWFLVYIFTKCSFLFTEDFSLFIEVSLCNRRSSHCNPSPLCSKYSGTNISCQSCDRHCTRSWKFTEMRQDSEWARQRCKRKLFWEKIIFRRLPGVWDGEIGEGFSEGVTVSWGLTGCIGVLGKIGGNREERALQQKKSAKPRNI